MKKWIVLPLAIIILITAAALLLMPWVVGKIVQDKYTAMLNGFTRDDIVKLSVVSYERHWFNSNVVVNVTVNPYSLLKMSEDVPEENRLITFKLTQEIQHGPLLPVTPKHRQAHQFLGLAMIRSHLEPKIGKIDAISMININGALVSVLNAPTLRYHSTPLNLSLQIKNLGFTLFNTQDLKQMQGEFHVSELRFKTNELQQQIENLKTSFNLFRGEGDLLLGKRDGTVNYVSWQLPENGSKIELEGVKMYAASGLVNGKISTETGLIITNLNVDKAQYGRQEIDLAIEDIDLPAFLLLRKELSNIEENNTLSLENAKNYTNIMLLLINKGISIDLKKLYVSTPWGNPEVKAKLYFAPSTKIAANIVKTLEHLSADARLHLPSIFLVKAIENFAPMADQVGLPALAVPQNKIREQINAWVAGNSLIPAEKGFIIDLAYKDNQFYLNGDLFNAENFMAQKVESDPVIEIKVDTAETQDDVEPSDATDKTNEADETETDTDTNIDSNVEGEGETEESNVVSPASDDQENIESKIQSK